MKKINTFIIIFIIVFGFTVKSYNFEIKLSELLKLENEAREELKLYSGNYSNSVKRIVVLDAGHGGKDSGATGNGAYEKKINLKTGYYLKKYLEDAGFKVIMTRNDDKYIPLRVRTLIANRELADLFVSIHTNAAVNKKAKGFEVFFCTDKASDAEAERVATYENSYFESNEEKSKIKVISTSDIIDECKRKNNLNKSYTAAWEINSRIKNSLSLKNRGTKSANFLVLRTVKMPGILVELGFISNAEEAKLLKSDKFLKNMSAEITSAVKDYLK